MHDNIVILSIMTLTEGKIVQHDQLIKWTQFFGDFSNPEDWLGVSPHPAQADGSQSNAGNIGLSSRFSYFMLDSYQMIISIF